MVDAASGTNANGKSPIHDVFQMYFSGLESFGQAYDPYTKAFARTQLEVMGLISRQAQAYMQIPARLSRCRTPQDLAEEQMRFWRTSFDECATSIGRVTEAFAAGIAPAFAQATSTDETKSEHDYITFPEPEELPSNSGHPRGRRAA
jgi:hypothetical protein